MKRRVQTIVGGILLVGIAAVSACSDDPTHRDPSGGGGGADDATGTSASGDYSAATSCEKLFAVTCARKTACGAYAGSSNICLSYNSCAYDAYRWGQECERRAAGEVFPRETLEDCEASLASAPCDTVCGGELPSECSELPLLTEDLLDTWFPSCDAECVP